MFKILAYKFKILILNITLILRLEGITLATWNSGSEEVSLCVSHFKFWALRVDLEHVGVKFWPLELNFEPLRVHFLAIKESFGPIGVDFALLGVEFWPLRVNHHGLGGVDFWTPGNRFLAAESLFWASKSLLIVEFRSHGVDFNHCGIDLGTLEVVIRSEAIDYRPLRSGSKFSIHKVNLGLL